MKRLCLVSAVALAVAAALFVALPSLPTVDSGARAQGLRPDHPRSEYPTSKSIRRSGGSHGYFDLGPKQSQPIVHVQQAEVYRICIQGEKATVVADGLRVELDHGDCFDVQAKNISVEKKGGQDETEGTYRRVP